MLYSPFVVLNDYNNNLAWTWKRNVNDLTKYNKSKDIESMETLNSKPSSSNNKIKRKRGLSVNMCGVSNQTNGGWSNSECSDTATLCAESRINGLTKKRSLRDLKNVTTHPLSHVDNIPNDDTTTSNDEDDKTLPQVDLLNLDDLDLKEDYFSMDSEVKLKDSYKPLFSRINVNYTKQKDIIRKKQISKQLNDQEYELESWPNEEKTGINDNGNTNNDNLTLIPNKRTRQRISNPNFLKLYAIENNSIQRNHLPQISIDDQSLQNVNTNNLSQLNFDPKIKLAIMTKKKIWIDLFGGIERNDLYGDNCPWNLKFVPDESTHPFINSTLNEKVDNNNNNNNVTMSQENISSLVRLNSNLRPWKFNSNTDTQANLDQSLLTPCGKLSRGQNYSDLQYVIKGWCDKRFQ
ncbi:hypothetical protein C6P44_001792 [Monosporozyma unispora]|nr:hypothetical protein C6P44_001792 [Kazachstania unispora]